MLHFNNLDGLSEGLSRVVGRGRQAASTKKNMEPSGELLDDILTRFVFSAPEQHLT